MAAAPGTDSTPPAFAVDAMLGRLARWLRVLGYDAAYGPHLRRRVLVECARREGRLLLTRDTHLVRERDLPPHVFVVSDHFREQLRQVAAEVPLHGATPLRRCLECNRSLDAVPRARAEGRVPAYVWETQSTFLHCAGCDRLFWPATHGVHMRAELTALGLAPEGAGWTH